MVDGIVGVPGLAPKEMLSTLRADQAQRFRNADDVVKGAVEYESYFLAYLMKMMRNTVPKGQLTSNPMGETFHSFYDEEIAKRAAEAGGIGLADYVLRSLAENGPASTP